MKNELPYDIRMIFLEQLLSRDIARHVELNCESLATYDRLRADIWRYAERVLDNRRKEDPMQIGWVANPGPEDAAAEPGVGATRLASGEEGGIAAMSCWGCGQKRAPERCLPTQTGGQSDP